MLLHARVRQILMTREEFYRRSEDRNSGLIDWKDGTAIQMPPAHSRHGYFILYLCGPLDQHLRAAGKGKAWQETFVDFPDFTSGTDIVVLLQEHLARHQKGRIQGPPDLIVEVVSTDSEARDRGVKFEQYWQQRVPWYWIGDPEAITLEEFRWTADGYLRTAFGTLEKPFSPQAVPGFSVDLGTLVDLDEEDTR